MSTTEPVFDPLVISDFHPEEAELRLFHARIIKRGIKPISFGLFITFLFLTISHFLLRPPENSALMAPVAFISSLFYLVIYFVARSYDIPIEYANGIGAIMAGVGLFNSILHLVISNDPLMTTNFMMVILAVAGLFLSGFWFTLIISLAVASWVMILLFQPLPLDYMWIHFSLAMAVTVAIAFLIMRVRWILYRTLASLQLQNKNQELRLRESHLFLEERVRERTAELADLNTILQEEIDRRQEVEEQLIANQKILKKERSQLEIEVANRTSELRKANIELRNAAQLKDEFMANMSHELRTPLNAILGNSEIILERLYGPINERQVGAIQRIEDSGRHLLNLISDILDVSKIEAGKLELNLSPVNIGSLCRNTIAMMRAEAALKKIELSLILDPAVKIVVADGRRVKQVIVNLMGNAIKFTPEGGRVGLIVRGRPEDGLMNIMVWDTGVGIDEKQSQRLFQPFVQLESPLAKEQEGTGLGLALSRKFAELHGGTIGVKSKPGSGSLFIVTLPWTIDTRVNDSAELIIETVTDGEEHRAEYDFLKAMPADPEPTQIFEMITQSPDLESLPPVLEIGD